MIPLVLHNKGEFYGDRHAMEMAIEYHYLPLRLKNLHVSLENSTGDKLWRASAQTVIYDITKRYLDANPRAVTEMISTDKSIIIVKGTWEPATADVCSTDVKQMVGFEPLECRNYIREYMTTARDKYEAEDRERQMSFHYGVKLMSEVPIEEPNGQFKVVSLFSLNFKPTMLKRSNHATAYCHRCIGFYACQFCPTKLCETHHHMWF